MSTQLHQLQSECTQINNILMQYLRSHVLADIEDLTEKENHGRD